MILFEWFEKSVTIKKTDLLLLSSMQDLLLVMARSFTHLVRLQSRVFGY